MHALYPPPSPPIARGFAICPTTNDRPRVRGLGTGGFAVQPEGNEMHVRIGLPLGVKLLVADDLRVHVFLLTEYKESALKLHSIRGKKGALSRAPSLLAPVPKFPSSLCLRTVSRSPDRA